jgi:hypothetical protein
MYCSSSKSGQVIVGKAKARLIYKLLRSIRREICARLTVIKASDAIGGGCQPATRREIMGLAIRTCRRGAARRRAAHAQESSGRVLDDPYDWLAAKNWREVLRDPDALPSTSPS